MSDTFQPTQPASPSLAVKGFREWLVTGKGKVEQLGPFNLLVWERCVGSGKLYASIVDGRLEVRGKTFKPTQVEALREALGKLLPPDHPATITVYRPQHPSVARKSTDTIASFHATVPLQRLCQGADAINKREATALSEQAEWMAAQAARALAAAPALALAVAKRQSVTAVLDKLVSHWISTMPNIEDPQSINEGPCAEYAQDAVEALQAQFPEADVEVLDAEEVLSGEGLCMPNYYHTFLKIDGFYFDAEQTAGTPMWQSLPFFRRNKLNIVPEGRQHSR